jgi:putative transposase
MANGNEISVVETLSSLSLSMVGQKTDASWSDKTALDQSVLKSEKVKKWYRICQEAQEIPKGVRKKAWIIDVATRNNVSVSALYRRLRRFKNEGIGGLHHRKSNRGKTKIWTPEALEHWIGLVLKKEHRKIHRDALYAELAKTAEGKGWLIGSYKSALWWIKKRVSPQLLALQNGGMRSLDNYLPPVIRNYSDLQPFNIIVGDQHKFDFWVTDEETGEVFRPEGFFFQDLRTRCFYGGAIDRKYDSYLIGLAARMGLKIFGPFGSIYTDNGKPEMSKYVMGILKDVRVLGLDIKQTVDANIDITTEDVEEINPLVEIAGTHRKALVKNAKAKMIEGTFNVFEGILRDHFLVPGYVKKLGGSQEENEVDQKEVEALAKAGKLLTFREFCLTVLRAMDFYNQRKHRGVLKEWVWKPRPEAASPYDCLMKCYDEGCWKPVKLSDEVIDLIFLPRATRIVNRGRISFKNLLFEDDRLMKLHGQKVQIRFDPLDLSYLLIFKKDEYFARATIVEYSSMKDLNLAKRKIEEKRRKRRGFMLEYKELTTNIPDIRHFSEVSTLEKSAAKFGRDRRKAITEKAFGYKGMTDEELAAAVERLELRQLQKTEENGNKVKKIPARPAYFTSEKNRYEWIRKVLKAGGENELNEADSKFKEQYELFMTDYQLEYWRIWDEAECASG